MADIISFSEIQLTPTNRKKRGRDIFIVAKDIDVRLNGSFLCRIERGFESDGASMPALVRAKWTSWGKYAGPALLHDHLLTTTDKPKWLCDVLFYVALRCNGVSALEAGVFWLAVRVKRARD